MDMFTELLACRNKARAQSDAGGDPQQLVAEGLKLLEEIRFDSDSGFQDGSLTPKRLRDLSSSWATLYDRLVPLLCERSKGKEPEVVLGQWKPYDLQFEGHVKLPREVQRAILKDYLLYPIDFAQACQMSGVCSSAEIECLEEKIPPRWQDLRVKLAAEPASGLGTGCDPNHILQIGGEGLRLLDRGRVLCELQLEASTLTAEGLQDLRSTWKTVFPKLRSLPPGCRPDLHGLILVAQAAADQITELLDRIRKENPALLAP